ncbi:AsnC family protein [Actinopolyspora mortivallis]|uniref:AsnC family protein n=1 Tax=Actinopolyspora mortivallis TaxID=33906 RepID=UPI0003AB4793|nr:AsnC family protein [Actinopolyspora mortivallis]
MAAPDPVDIHLLNAVAETGRASIPELAAHLGMDVREVAARLAALSTSGLPLVVGVECDPNGIRNALAAVGVPAGPQYAPPQAQNPPSGGYPVPPAPQAGQPNQPSGPHSGAHPVYGGASGPYPPQSGPHPAPVPPQGPPQQPAAGPPPHRPSTPPRGHSAPPSQGAPTGWGPPASGNWTRATHAAQSGAPPRPPVPRSGKVGTKLDGVGPNGEPVSVLLVEVVDPADFLLSAAGHQLSEGQRAVVVHTELTNRGPTAFTAPPDRHLVLVTTEGTTVSKSSVSMSSRPPHGPTVSPGETGGGHTVFVLPEETELSTVEWSPTPEPGPHSLVWDITDS